MVIWRHLFKQIKIITLIIISILFIIYKISYSNLNNQYYSKLKFFQPVISKLIANNVDSSFIEMLIKNESTQFDGNYIKINVIGYLTKSDYSHHYDNYSVRKTYEFIIQNTSTFEKCEEKFKIPKEIIASIIWIESKNGNYLGKHHIPSVLLSSALAAEPQFIDFNRKNLNTILKDSSLTDIEMKEYETKLISRSIKKSKRAIEELIALYKIYKTRSIDVTNMYGSWAGAFGLPQFLPSSYLKWAIDGNEDNKIDLFNIDDAIMSIGNYLKINGWSNNYDDQRKSVFHYNNSQDYVKAVFILSNRVKKYEKLFEPID